MAKPSGKLNCASCSSRFLGVLCNLDNEGLGECDEHKTTNQYKKGQVIFYEGNQAYGLYCVYSGRVKLYKADPNGRQQIVRICGPGDILGYRSLFADEPYSATAEVMEDATVCCVDRKAFFPLLSKNPDLSFAIIKKLSKELREAEDMATRIAHRSVRERMADLLLMLKETYGKPAKRGVLIGLKLSREEMAEMIGVTQETAIRLLSEFKKEGLIEVKDRDIAILNPQGLLSAANPAA